MKANWRWALIALGLLTPISAAAQERTAVAVAGPHYEADGIVEALAGSGWRVLWTTPVEVPVLDLGTYGGGLTPLRQGGRQSRTLHFKGADGHLYIFRSVDKFLHKEALPEAMRHTASGRVVQDQVSMLLPAAGLVVAPLFEAAGLLHPTSTLVVMPDDPRLGEHRETFAGMLGQIEENPQEGEDGTAGFAGSKKILGAENFLEQLDTSLANRVHVREYLATRLIHFMIGDTDRGSDQWRFAELPHPSGTGTIWRPIARDHDFAFMLPTGVLGAVARSVYPKIARFGDNFASLRTLTSMTREMDRALLAELPRETWDSVATALQSRLDDGVLRAAVARLPREWREHAGDLIYDGLQARRDELPTITAEFYDMVTREPDIHASAEPERVEIERLADGSVEVRLFRGYAPVAAAQPAPPRDPADMTRTASTTAVFQRRFYPSETNVIRVYMHGGDDEVRVIGTAPSSIVVHVIGGPGNDNLHDSSVVQSGGVHTVFYTAKGNDRVVHGAVTRVDAREFDSWLPRRPDDLRERVSDAVARVSEAVENDSGPGLHEDIMKRLGLDEYQDWGSIANIGPYVGFPHATGLVIGGGPRYTQFSLRHLPYRFRVGANVLFAVQRGTFGVDAFGTYHFANSDFGIDIETSATQFEAFKFFGFGNNTPNVVSPRVDRDQFTFHPSVFRNDDGVDVSIGPIFRYGNPRFDEFSPIAVLQPEGSQSYAQFGAGIDLDVHKGKTLGSQPRGFKLDATLFAYPEFMDVESPFAHGELVARGWIPLGRPFLALRAGSEMALGDFPVHEAAFLGGRSSLRGFETDRFAGDYSLFGTTELHLPLGSVRLLVRGEYGVHTLVDVGRVYFDGESPGGWHTSYGGGLWFSTLGRILSLTYAYGDVSRLYIKLGTSL